MKIKAIKAFDSKKLENHTSHLNTNTAKYFFKISQLIEKRKKVYTLSKQNSSTEIVYLKWKHH